MVLISSNTKNARIELLAFAVLSLIFIATILFMINPPLIILVYISLIFSSLYFFSLKFYFLDWDILVGDNKIILNNIFRTCAFTSTTPYKIKGKFFLSLFYSIYCIKIESKNFYFFYKRDSVLTFNTNDVVIEIENKINRNIVK